MEIKQAQNVLATDPNQEYVIKPFDGEELYPEISREEALAELGKTGVSHEKATGKLVTDGVSGEVLGLEKSNDNKIDSLQDITPEMVKLHLTSMVRENLKFMLLEDKYTDDEIDETITNLETKLAELDIKDVKSMTPMDLRQIYGADMFDTIKKIHPQDYINLAKTLLVEFRDGMTESENVIDTMDEINKHLRFFKDLDIDKIDADINNSIDESGVVFETKFHRYAHYLKLYYDRIETTSEPGNKFREVELKMTKDRMLALEDAMNFTTLFKKCDSAMAKILKDLKNPKACMTAIQNFAGQMYSDQSIRFSFPIPKNFEVTSQKGAVVTAIFIGAMELMFMRRMVPAINNLLSFEYTALIQTLMGQPVDDVVEIPDREPIDYNKFIQENHLTKEQYLMSQRGAFTILYILSRAFKPSEWSNTHVAYTLSYTMDILTQSLSGDTKSLVDTMIDGITERIADARK